MKLIILFLSINVLQISANVYSQKSSITVKDRNLTLKEVIEVIEEQTDYRFVFRDNFLDEKETVNISAEEKEVEDLLPELFANNNLKYIIFEDYLIVITSDDDKNLKQEFVVKGKVTDSDGQPLPGVNIQEKGTTTGAVTDLDGNYTIEVSSNDAVLAYSFVGFLTEEIEVSGQTTIDVILVEDILSLDEVVVIGYGTQKKGDITSAIVSVKSEDFLAGKMQDAAELIKGKVAGLSITKGSGDPNAESSIILRGVSSIEGGYKPLVLIDGNPGDLTDVAPENIESIDVLKDASAAAIYGTRGANGVIIITTKSGRRSESVTVKYSGYVSFSDFLKEAEFMSPSDIRFGKTSFSDDGWDTDWVKAVTQNGFTNNHSLSIDGGTETTAYAGNFSYLNEDGTIVNSNKEQYKMQFNVTQYVWDDMLRFNLNILKGVHTNSATDATQTDPRNIYRQAVIHNPTSPIYNDDGTYFEEDRFQYFNPVALVEELYGETKSEWTRLTGNITFEPIENWETNLMMSTHRYNENLSTYTTSKHGPTAINGYAGSSYKRYKGNEKNYLDLTTRYQFSLLNKHRVSALAGYSYSDEMYDEFTASNSDFPTDSYYSNNIGVGSLLKDGKAGMSSDKNDNKLIGFFGRLTYNFDDKYNLLVSVRREGSSKFGADHQWGTFPAAQIGWTISNESFMKNIDVIDNLKLRAGYGVTGVIANDPYKSLITYDYDSDYGNFVNRDGEWVPGLKVEQNPNPDLHWETTEETNIGIDFGLLKGRINGAIDVYSRKSSDLLYYYSVPVPPNLFSETLANAGSIENKGIELMIDATPVKVGDFQWNTVLTLAHNRNELLSLSNDLYETEDYQDRAYAGDPISVPTHRIELGSSIGKFWGLKSVGVTEDGIWLIEDPNTGDVLEYTTALNTNTYRQYLGNGFPKIYMGFNNTFRYKDFDLNVQMSGQFGFQILNEQRMFYENNSIQYNRLKTAADPVYGIAPLSSAQAQAFVSYYIEEGDYLKVDNVTLGYTLDTRNFTNKISGLRFYVAGQNLLTFTDYSGLDPELSNSNVFAAGNDPRDKYPTIRSFTIGLNVTF